MTKHVVVFLIAVFATSEAATAASVEQFLGPDGRIDLARIRRSGYQGELDVSGFRTRLDVDGPRLERTTATNTAGWSDEFAVPSVEFFGAMTGFGGALIVGDGFEPAGGVLVRNLARWDGVSWTSLGGGTGGTVTCLAIFSGHLIVDGIFDEAGPLTDVNNIARWDGVAWHKLGTGINGAVHSLTVHFLAQLIVGGEFLQAGGVPANRIASWNGSAWSALGAGMDAPVMALRSYAGDVIAGGGFTMAGGVEANGVARWNGSAWSAMDTGFLEDAFIRDFEVFGGQLHACGQIAMTFLEPMGVVRWTGSAWTKLGTGVRITPQTHVIVEDLQVFGTKLVVAGRFDTAGAVPVSNIAAWDGAAWSAIDAGFDPLASIVYTLGVGDGVLYAGAFGDQSSSAGFRFQRYDGTSWARIGGAGLDDRAMAILPGPFFARPGPAIGGYFRQAGGAEPQYVAEWGGAGWYDLSPNHFLALDGPVLALTEYQGDLVAGGLFSAPSHVAFHPSFGAGWSPLGQGLNGTVFALTNFGGFLIAGGSFTASGATPLSHIARWSGSWTPLGAGLNGDVEAFAVYQGQLIAAGSFTASGAQPASRLARWDGTAWQPLGSGIAGGPFPNIAALAVFDGKLFAAGQFTLAGGVPAQNLACWNGSSWSVPGFVEPGPVYALAVYHGALLAGGNITQAGGVAVPAIARWDGTTWGTIGGGVAGQVSALGVQGDDLWVSGFITSAGSGTPSQCIARYTEPSPVAVGDAPALVGIDLAPAAPNPMSNLAQLRYALPREGPVRLDLFDVQGRRVANLANELRQSTGTHTVEWDGTADGQRVGAGVYLLRLEALGEVRTRRLVRLP